MPRSLTLLALLVFFAARDAAADESRKPRLDPFGDPLPDEAIARMGSGRLRHGGGGRRQLAFTPDGQSIVSRADGRLRIWDVATGKLRRRLQAATESYQTFVFTAGSMAVANLVGRENGSALMVQILDPASGKIRRSVEILQMKGKGAPGNVTFSPDGKRIALSTIKAVRLFDTITGKEILSIDAPRRFVTGIAFAPDGKTIAFTDLSDTLPIHDAGNGNLVRRLQREGDLVGSPVFSPDGRFLAASAMDQKDKTYTVPIWDIHTGKERYRLKSPASFVSGMAFSPDGKYLAMGCQHTDLLLWDTAMGKEVRRFPTGAFFSGVAFSPDGAKLAAISNNGVIHIWDAATSRVLPSGRDPFFDIVQELRFRLDGRRLLGRAPLWIAWESGTGREVRRISNMLQDGRPDYSLLSPDGKLFARIEPDATIHLRDAATGKEVRVLKGHDKATWHVLFSSDSRRLISSGTDATIRVWDVANGRQLRKLTGCGENPAYLTLSPDGRCLASIDSTFAPQARREIMLWDLDAGRQRGRLPLPHMFHSNLAFSSDGRFLAAGCTPIVPDGQHGEIKVWNVVEATEARTIAGMRFGIASVAFAPDGRTLASGGSDGSVILWELAGGRRRHSFTGHDSRIFALAFSPNSRTLAASSADAPVYVWDVAGRLDSRPRRLSKEELQRDWDALAGADAAAAFGAIRRLAAAPEQTLPFLRQHLEPVPAPDPKRIRQLVDMLDSENFPDRQKASEELEKQADVAASQLRQIMAKEKPSLEVRRRLQQILEGIERLPEALRAVRAVEVLEWIATADAVHLLGELANGAADARLTREAAATKRRLAR